MAKIGSLTVDFKANTASWNRGLKDAQRQVASTRARVNRTLNKMVRDAKRAGQRIGKALKKGLAGPVVGLVAGLVGALGVGAIVLATKKYIAFADKIGKVADKIGLSTTALQELRFAADRSGVGMNALDMGMQRFSRRVAEVAAGQGVLLPVFKQYNIQVKDAQGNTRKLTDILGDYADKIKGAGSDQERLRLAFKAFDSEGAALVNLFKSGKIGIEEYAVEAKRLGIILDGKLVRSAESLKDKLTNLETQMRTQLARTFLEMGPVVVALASDFLKVAVAALKAFVQFSKFIGLIDKHQIDKVNDRIAKKKQKLRFVSMFAKDPTGRFPQSVERADALKAELAGLREFRDKIKKHGSPGDAASSEFSDLRKFGLPDFRVKSATTKVNPPLSGGGSAANSRLAELKRLQEAEKQFVSDSRRRWLENTNQRVRLVKIERDAEIAKAQKLITNETQLRETLGQINEVYTQKIKEARKQELDAALNANEQMRRAFDFTVDAFGRTLDFGLDAIDIFTSGSKDKMKSLRDVAVSMLKDIQSMIWDTFVRTPLQAGLNDALKGSGGLGNFFKNLFSGGGSGPSVAHKLPRSAPLAIGFAAGGTGIVGGRPGRDKNLVMMGLTKGERLTVETQQQQRRPTGAGKVVE